MKKIIALIISGLLCISSVFCNNAVILTSITAKADSIGYWTDDGNYSTGFAGGDGWTSTPYIISTPQQLAYFLKELNNGNHFQNTCFEISNDIDMSGHLWISNYTSNAYFQGDFNGQGYSIKGLTINNSDNTPYAFIYDNSGTIRNIHFTDLNITSTNCGAVAVTATNDGTINNCYLTGAINSSYQISNLTDNNGGVFLNSVSGFSLENNGTIINCGNSSTISSGTYASALTIRNFGTVTNCTNTAKISGAYVGGLIYFNEYGNSLISNCYNANSVYDDISNSKSICYWNYSSASKPIYNCYWQNESVEYTKYPVSDTSLNLLVVNPMRAIDNIYWFKDYGCAKFGAHNSSTLLEALNLGKASGSNTWAMLTDGTIMPLLSPRIINLVKTPSYNSLNIYSECDISLNYGSNLSDIKLPVGFTWEQDPQSKVLIQVGSGNVLYSATLNSSTIANADQNTSASTDTFTKKPITNIALIVHTTSATPVYTVPNNITAVYGDTLAKVSLPQGFSWDVSTNTKVGNVGARAFMAKYNCGDVNYKTVNAIPITVDVQKAKLNANPINLNILNGQQPNYHLNISGFVNGEKQQNLSGFIAPSMTSTTNIGDNTITCYGGNPTDNYTFNYGTGVLTVNNVNATSNDFDISTSGWSNNDVVITPKNGYTSIYDGTQWLNNITISTEGTQTVTFRLKKPDGTTSENFSVQVKIDKTKPIISIPSNTRYIGARIEAEDSLSGIKDICVNGNISSDGVIYGAGDYSITAIDNAGNTDSANITVNAIPQTLTSNAEDISLLKAIKDEYAELSPYLSEAQRSEVVAKLSDLEKQIIDDKKAKATQNTGIIDTSNLIIPSMSVDDDLQIIVTTTPATEEEKSAVENTTNKTVISSFELNVYVNGNSSSAEGNVSVAVDVSKPQEQFKDIEPIAISKDTNAVQQVESKSDNYILIFTYNTNNIYCISGTPLSEGSNIIAVPNPQTNASTNSTATVLTLFSFFSFVTVFCFQRILRRKHIVLTYKGLFKNRKEHI